MQTALYPLLDTTLSMTRRDIGREDARTDEIDRGAEDEPHGALGYREGAR
ncbi:hypothetical protein RYH80_15795 [Halobaculum sp. MBLA0147]